MNTAVFSIISPNYRHYARVLMDSMQRNHPDWDRFVLCVGDPSAPSGDAEPFTAVPLDTLPLPNPRQFCFRYTLLELNTAVKPWMFEHLFARGYDRVIYFDPDIFIYSPLAELDAAPPQTFITLTPHLTGSIAGDEHPSERTILQAGTYNLGFLAVTRQPALSRFLAWWKGKLEFQCLFDPARGLFVDQKWMDLAPGLFPDVSILRHEGYNVAYWNLRQRSVVAANGATTVNGQPLRFFHFSGLDPTLPEMVSVHDRRLRLADIGHARMLIEEYRVALRAAGYDSFKKARYGFGVFADGTRVPDAARIAYLNSTELQAAAGSDPFAHPELFRGIRDPLVKRIGPRTFRMLLRVRPITHWLPGPVRGALRNLMVGRREATSEER
ncbi:MAG TPA: group 1 glycosyl transferase [Thermoanaerobaculia bacterium]|jgi:hypothetical protein|nr:group 1 glycosyl transferase [Thermoanaerobaculia bacterium]